MREQNTLAHLGLFCCVILSGCQTIKSYFGGSETQPSPVAAPVVVDQTPKEDLGPRFSDSPQLPTPVDRQYKRMTRTRLEEESELQSGAGSLWVMDGQQSYLFAQNKIRREGDVLGVKLDGQALKQVETKVSIIKKLLKQLEEEERKSELMIQQQQLAALANAGQSPKGPSLPGPNGDRTPAAVPGAAPGVAGAQGIAAGATAAGSAAAVAPLAATPPKPAESGPTKEEKQDLSEIQIIPTRIVERLADGNYKVKGAQPFMIGQKEYKVIVAGIIRPEDYNDEGVSSVKLLDPQFDVLSVRRKSKDDKTTTF